MMVMVGMLDRLVINECFEMILGLILHGLSFNLLHYNNN